MNETLHILTIKGNHSKSTRAEFVAGFQARGATVQFGQSRLGDFEVVKVNGQAVARAFKSQIAMIGYMARA
jgi:hypothetical protein